MDFIANNYEPKDIYKFIRQASDKTHSQIAKDMRKTEDWSKSIESGRLNYKFKDLLDICNKNNIQIIIRKKD